MFAQRNVDLGDTHEEHRTRKIKETRHKYQEGYETTRYAALEGLQQLQERPTAIFLFLMFCLLYVAISDFVPCIKILRRRIAAIDHVRRSGDRVLCPARVLKKEE